MSGNQCGSAEPAPQKRDKHTVHWFRKGLRLHDNPSFREGLKDAVTFRCIFIIDPWFAGSSNVGINKWRFVSTGIKLISSENRCAKQIGLHKIIIFIFILR